jgi:hypothetical protein
MRDPVGIGSPLAKDLDWRVGIMHNVPGNLCGWEGIAFWIGSFFLKKILASESIAPNLAMYPEGTLLNVIMGRAFRITEFSSQNGTVGFPIYKMLARFF